MQLHNIPITLSTITRLPAPPRVPADLFRLVDECDAGLSPQAIHCIETAARSERKKDAAARKGFLANLIATTLKGM